MVGLNGRDFEFIEIFLRQITVQAVFLPSKSNWFVYQHHLIQKYMNFQGAIVITYTYVTVNEKPYSIFWSNISTVIVKLLKSNLFSKRHFLCIMPVGFGVKQKIRDGRYIKCKGLVREVNAILYRYMLFIIYLYACTIWFGYLHIYSKHVVRLGKLWIQKDFKKSNLIIKKTDNYKLNINTSLNYYVLYYQLRSDVNAWALKI